MDFPIHTDTMRLGLSILYFKGSQFKVSKICFSVAEDGFILANSVDPYEMPHYAAFHLGLHCL